MARKRKRKDEIDIKLKVVNGFLATAVAIFALMTIPLPTIQGFIEDLFQIENVPESSLASLEYDGREQVIEVNGDVPTFSEKELSLVNGSWQEFSEIDFLNRVGPANAMLSKELFPTEEREPLYIKPTVWKQKKMDNGGWLYNRSHLIGFQFTGENNNIRNLMTGTRSLNSPQMLRFENDIAYYLKETGNHVRYLVEPVFREQELVARGIHLMAQSIEDDELSFNVYIYNIEEGYVIDYQDGSSIKAK